MSTNQTQNIILVNQTAASQWEATFKSNDFLHTVVMGINNSQANIITTINQLTSSLNALNSDYSVVIARSATDITTIAEILPQSYK